jgi:acyl carrier protein
MELETFIKSFEEAVEDVEVGSLSGDTVYSSLELWDSLAVLTVIAMVDAEYDLRLKARELKQVETLSELHALLESKQSV